jgi:hypothetical protein
VLDITVNMKQFVTNRLNMQIIEILGN